MFVREGARVLVSDIDAEGGQQTIKLIHQKGGEAVFFKADISKVSEVEAMVGYAVDFFGRLDYANNNA
jgi:NAD(P)-dependent dehydrogenase (short-subunit alcohol dehydrogenase family)